MKHKRLLAILLTSILLISKNIVGQSLNELPQSEENTERKVTINAGIGLIELYSLGIGWQVSKDFCLTFNYSRTMIGKSTFLPSVGDGVGVKLTYFNKPFWIFNKISAMYLQYLYLSLDRKIDSAMKGSYFEMCFGKEDITAPGLNINWSAGVGVSAAKTAELLFMPSIKIGINYNFF